MFCINPIVAMLHNVSENRWHPILFIESPLPGPDEPGKPVRHKGHHTTGFAKRHEAVESAMELAQRTEPAARLCLDKDFEWDGHEIPAMVVYFDDNSGVLSPLLA
jgi:hypothetical protein